MTRNKADDHQVTISVYVVLLVSSTSYRMGKHLYNEGITDYKMSLQLWFYADLLYTVCSATLRVAAGEHLMRHISRKWQRVLVMVLTWTNIGYNIYMIFALISRCKPVHAYWNNVSWFTGEYETVCQLQIARNSTNVQMSLGAMTDIIYALLPLSIIRDIALSKAQRLAIIVVSIMALLSGAAALIRVPYLERMRPEQDWTWISVDIALWGMAELAVGIIALCLATFTPIMAYFWPKSILRLPRRRANLPFYHGEYNSGPDLQFSPHGRGYGNVSYVEGGCGKQKSGKRGKQTRQNSMDDFAVTVEDMGIMKTTEVSSSSEDDTSPASLPYIVSMPRSLPNHNLTAHVGRPPFGIFPQMTASTT